MDIAIFNYWYFFKLFDSNILITCHTRGGIYYIACKNILNKFPLKYYHIACHLLHANSGYKFAILACLTECVVIKDYILQLH